MSDMNLVLQEIKSLHKRHDKTDERIDSLDTAIRGNGEPGLKEQIRDNGQRIDLVEKHCKEQLDAIAMKEAEKKDDKKWLTRTLIAAVIIQLLIFVRGEFSDRRRTPKPDAAVEVRQPR